jgi:diguanylate cyclase (GGDEF)-like protein
MAQSTLWPFARKSALVGADGPAARAVDAARSNQDPRLRATIDLARELIAGVEHFVITTPDLDTPGFLRRLRTISSALERGNNDEELETHRIWSSQALSAFGQVQRRYLYERENELWRLLGLYQEGQKSDGNANRHFNEAIRGVHDRIGSVTRLDDLRQVRERLESELQRANHLIAEKERSDQERANALASQVKDLEEALVRAKDEAQRDPLTGIFHRGGFEAQLEALLASPGKCALAMIDVDNFKEINDTLGHLLGDQILQTVVQWLAQAARPGEVIGRYGGDEFCFLAPGALPERLADRLTPVAQPRNMQFRLEERHCAVRLSLSIGVAPVVAGDTRETLVERADAALYAAKRAGKGRAVIADES